MTTRLAAVLPLMLLACSKPDPAERQSSAGAGTAALAPAPTPPRPAQPGALLTHPMYLVANAFVGDIHAGRFEDAYAKMGKLYRGAVTLEKFRAAVQGSPYLKAATAYDPWSVDEKGGVGSTKGTLTKADVTVVIHCTYEDDGWRILGINTAGAPVLVIPVPTP